MRTISPFLEARARGPNTAGFSLVELLAVVAIMCILAALALPRFGQFLARARQVEAKTGLHSAVALEVAYQAQNDGFVAMSIQGRNGAIVACTANAIGFTLTPCDQKIRFGYTVRLISGGFVATATSGTGVNNKVFTGCATPDTWTMEVDGKLKQTFPTETVCR